ncbi:MAG: DUF3987 domain-containing protein [Bryobacteraceae bacterium]
MNGPPAQVTQAPPLTTQPSSVRVKPAAIAEAALHGITGDLVRLLMPHTESGLPSILVQFLAAVGLYIGRTGYYQAEGDRHHTNLFTVIVGNTSKGRKGTSWGQIRRLFRLVDEDFTTHITSGISTGEGIIWAARDEIREQHAVKEKGRVVGYEEVIADPGISDKRLLVQEPEFARVLKNAQRDSNNASAVIREAWDSGTLNILTKTKSARATGAHIGIIAHITAEELTRLLTNTEAANGFANRFLWVFTERSKELPFGGSLEDNDLLPIAARLRDVRVHAQGVGRINFDRKAAAAWERVYGPLSAGKPGLLGAVVARAEPQVMRIATLYALLDHDNVIRLCHLQAALAVWDYAEASAQYIFGDALGDDTADSILSYLRSVRTVGATRTEINNLFNRNKNSNEISRALAVLSEAGLAHMEPEQKDSGAPAERWFAGAQKSTSSYELNELNELSTGPKGANSSISYPRGGNGGSS